MRTFLLSVVCLAGLVAMGCSPRNCPESLFCLSLFDPLCQQYCEEEICNGVDDVEFAGCDEGSECVCECVSGGGTCDLGVTNGTGGSGGSGGSGASGGGNGSGGEGGGEQTTIRTGGTCDANDPEMEFICGDLCFEICLEEEVAQSDECTPDGVCSCTCVNYGL
jgi:hypothetical protein